MSNLITTFYLLNPLNAELNAICLPLVLLGAHHILHVSGIRLKCHRNICPKMSWCFILYHARNKV